MTIIVESQFEGQRLDSFLSIMIADLSRSKIKSMILQGLITVNTVEIKDPNYRVMSDDSIVIVPIPEQSSEIIPENTPLVIVYEDTHVLVLNKPFGKVMHPAAGNWEGTLANAIVNYLPETTASVVRGGIVHRLDKDTSGIVIVAKDNETLEFLQKQFRERTIEKRYRALVVGNLKYQEGIINAPIGRHSSNRKKFTIRKEGKEAITNYKLIHSYRHDLVSLLDVAPKTGRTHQIRVHLSHIGVPILGDFVYGRSTQQVAKKLGVTRQMLHAYYLKVFLPKGELKEFEIDLPEDMKAVIKKLDRQRYSPYSIFH